MKKFTVEDYIARAYNELRKQDFSEDDIQENVINLYMFLSRPVNTSISIRYSVFMHKCLHKSEEDDNIVLFSDLKYEDEYDRIYDPELHAMKVDLTSRISSMCSTLTFREQKVLKLRFEEDLSLRDTAEIIGVTPERIRQIEYKALRKCRHPSRSKKLCDFITHDFGFNIYTPCIDNSPYNKIINNQMILPKVNKSRIISINHNTVQSSSEYYEYLKSYIIRYFSKCYLRSTINKYLDISLFDMHTVLSYDVIKIIGYAIFWGADDKYIYDSDLMKRFIPDNVLNRMVTAAWIRYHCVTSGVYTRANLNQEYLAANHKIRLNITDLIYGYDKFAGNNNYVSYSNCNALTHNIIVGLLHVKRYILRHYRKLKLSINVMWMMDCRDAYYGKTYLTGPLVKKGDPDRFEVKSTEYYDIRKTDLDPNTLCVCKNEMNWLSGTNKYILKIFYD